MNEDREPTNREKKVEGRGKRRTHVQGTRVFIHAMTNGMAKRSIRPSPAKDQERDVD